LVVCALKHPFRDGTTQVRPSRDRLRLLADPEHEIRALLDWLELERPAAEVAAAAALVRRPPPRRVGPPFA